MSDQTQDKIRDLEERMGKVETAVAVAKTDIKALKDDLKSIKNNTTWILRIVVGSIVVYALKFLFAQGGGTVSFVDAFKSLL